MARDVRGWNGWVLLVVAVVVAVGIGVLAFVLRSSALVALATLPYALAALGAAVGASAFTPRDRMFWAWVALATGSLIGGLTCALTGRPPLKAPFGAAPFSEGLHAVLIVKVVLINVCTVVGLVIFAQAWRSLGPRPGWYRVATAVAFAVGLLAAGPSLLQGARAVAAGADGGWSAIVSSLGDLIAVTMIGPLAVTAVVMRGGAMAWPYTMLTLATLAWLLYDANAALTGDAQMIGDLVTASLGLTLSGAAGLAHRRALG